MAFLRGLLLSGLLWFQWVWVTAECVAAPSLAVVVPGDRSAAQEEALEALSAELQRGGVQRSEMVLVQAKDVATVAHSGPKLVIALGSVASQALLESGSRVPQLFTLLPRDGFESLLSRHKPAGPVAAIYLDQPVARQFALLRLALPKSKNVGLLLGPTSRTAEARLKSAALERQFRPVVVKIEQADALHSALQKVLDEADVLMAVADPMVYNANTIRNILLTSFRARVPLVTFSPAYVKAGAVLAVYSTPKQIGTQAGAIARDVLRGKPLPSSQYPVEFSLSVNPQVADSLGLVLDEGELTKGLRQLEKNP